MIIELTVCYTRESKQVKDLFLKTYWYEWTTEKMYFNINCITKFICSKEVDKVISDSTLGEIPFNTKLWVVGEKSYYYILETPQQIMNKIKKLKNN